MGKTLLPPGFRFHPTDTELVKYYLKRKVMGKKLCVDAISEVDIYKYSPWDLPDKSYLRTGDLKWYFFCPVEKKYGRGGRCNRATERGYWKATGKDRQVLYNQVVAGMIKTLVFHKGKAPKGERTDWVMHEYRLLEDGDLDKEGVVQDMYVLCVLFQKDGLGPRNGAQYGAPFREMDWSDDEGNCDVAVLLTSLSTPAFADPVGPSGSVATTSYAPEYLSCAPTTVDPNCSVAATSCAPKSLSYTPTDGSNATTSCAPKYLSYAPTTVDPNCSVAAISCTPESLSYTPTSFDHIDQDGSNATTSCAPMNSLSTLADPIKQVGSVAATENLLSLMPSAYEVLFPRAPDVPMPDEAFQFLSEDDVQAMLAMFSEDKPWEEMCQGPTNHFDVAIPSPYAPSHDGHIDSLVTGSCSGIASLPVSSSSTHVPLPSAGFNVPSTTHGANNGFTSMNASSSPVQGDDDIESLLAIFTEDDSICNQPFSF